MKIYNTEMYFAKYKMGFIKEKDFYYIVKEREVEATIYVRNESGEVEEITGFTIEYDRDQVNQDEVLNIYHNVIGEMNNLYYEVEKAEKTLEELETKYNSKKEEVSKFEEILPEDLHAKDEDNDDSEVEEK